MKQIMSALLVAAAVAPILSAAQPAEAHWKPQYANASPEIQQWYSEQKNAKGTFCCNKADGHDYWGNYTLNADGSVTLNLSSGPHTLPKYMVLADGPNLAQHPVWWYYDDGHGVHVDYCFKPGAET